MMTLTRVGVFFAISSEAHPFSRSAKIATAFLSHDRLIPRVPAKRQTRRTLASRLRQADFHRRGLLRRSVPDDGPFVHAFRASVGPTQPAIARYRTPLAAMQPWIAHSPYRRIDGAHDFCRSDRRRSMFPLIGANSKEKELLWRNPPSSPAPSPANSFRKIQTTNPRRSCLSGSEKRAKTGEPKQKEKREHSLTKMRKSCRGNFS
jgi:hypothetical protein